MADASLHKDFAEAKRLIQKFSEVVHGGKMSSTDREEALATISNKDDVELKWIRRQEEWRRVYPTWVKKLAVVAAAAAVLLFALLRGASCLTSNESAVAAKGEVHAFTEESTLGDAPELVAAKGETRLPRTLVHAKGERQT